MGSLWPAEAGAHGSAGHVQPPVPVSGWQVQTHTGQTIALAELLRGRITAVQWMFTGCSTVCPIQGAQFANLRAVIDQRGLNASDGRVSVQLLSMSIDALGDTPQTLARWLERFAPQSASPAPPARRTTAWLAAVPGIKDVARLREQLDGPEPTAYPPDDPHSKHVMLIDADARLRWRSLGLPRTEVIADALAAMRRAAG